MQTVECPTIITCTFLYCRLQIAGAEKKLKEVLTEIEQQKNRNMPQRTASSIKFHQYRMLRTGLVTDTTPHVIVTSNPNSSIAASGKMLFGGEYDWRSVHWRRSGWDIVPPFSCPIKSLALLRNIFFLLFVGKEFVLKVFRKFVYAERGSIPGPACKSGSLPSELSGRSIFDSPPTHQYSGGR